MEAERSGVYRTPAHVAALRKEAGKAGFQWFDVPLQAVSGKKQFFAVCAKQLKLPSYFGGNWDALADCVRDFSWVSGAGYVLHISGSEKFSQAAPDEYQTALAVLREAAEFWKEKSVPFMVFVDAAGDLPAF
jgi:RNAse (barnase) inhibitor barstar